MSEIGKTIGNRIRMYRQKSGLSQDRLGGMAGLHNTYIGQIERGEKNVSIESVDKIMQALGLSYEVLFANIGYGDTGCPIAAECYDLICGLPEKQQKLMLDIIKKAVELREN